MIKWACNQNRTTNTLQQTKVKREVNKMLTTYITATAIVLGILAINAIGAFCLFKEDFKKKERED